MAHKRQAEPDFNLVRPGSGPDFQEKSLETLEGVPFLLGSRDSTESMAAELEEEGHAERAREGGGSP